MLALKEKKLKTQMSCIVLAAAIQLDGDETVLYKQTERKMNEMLLAKLPRFFSTDLHLYLLQSDVRCFTHTVLPFVDKYSEHFQAHMHTRSVWLVSAWTQVIHFTQLS